MIVSRWIAGAKHYYLQPFRESAQVMMRDTYHAPDRETLILWKELLSTTIPRVDIRGID